MSRFNFKYKKVLDIKVKKEDQVKMLLSEAYVKLNAERDTLKKIEELLQELIDDCRRMMEEGCSCYDLRQKNTYISYTRDKIKFQEGVIAKCLDEIEEVKIKLLDAMKERKTFEKLEEKQLDEFIEAEKKAEAASIDEIVTYKNSTL